MLFKLCIQLYFIAALFLTSCSSQTPPPEPADNVDIEITDTSHNTSTPPINVVDSYEYLNGLRTDAGMITLSKNVFLAQAAANHAQYLVDNNTISHSEIPGKTGFSGVTPGDRAVAAGYNTSSVREGISTANSEQAALDDLFSAIYHRFTLLNFESDEIGMALATKGSADSFVHNMGNSRLDSLCQRSESITVGRYYTGICKQDIQLSATDFEAENAYNANLNPSYVLWPPVNGSDIPPAFFEEIPDPLPDYSVSGYPVSIQFNELKAGEIFVSDFRLLNLSNQQYVSNTRLMDINTDPNNSFASSEFALFPLERLQWATNYRAELEYSEDGMNKTLNWEFSTRSLDGKIIQLSPSDRNINIQSGVKTFLYFTPEHGTDLINNISSSFPQGTVVIIQFVDQNTLEVVVSGSVGDRVTLSINAKRAFSITISAS